MIIDAQNTFSNLANGDSPTAVADNASASYIDQMPGGVNFSPPGGGAYVAPWVIVQVRTAFTSGGAATIQAVLQDAPDTSTTLVPAGPGAWTDRILGAVFTVGGNPAPSVNTYLMTMRILPSLARYLRVVYRIGTAVMTGGVVQSFLALDTDVVDLALREVGSYVSQSGQLSEAVAQGILAQ